MTVDDALYRRLKDAGLSHTASLILADSENQSFAGGSLGAGGGGGMVPYDTRHNLSIDCLFEGTGGGNSTLTSGPGVSGSTVVSGEVWGDSSESVLARIDGIDGDYLYTVVNCELTFAVASGAGPTLGDTEFAAGQGYMILLNTTDPTDENTLPIPVYYDLPASAFPTTFYSTKVALASPIPVVKDGLLYPSAFPDYEGVDISMTFSLRAVMKA